LSKRKNVTEETLLGFIGDTQPTDKRRTNEVQASDNRQTNDALTRYNIRLHESDWNRLKQVAAAEGTSASAVIRRLVKKYLNG